MRTEARLILCDAEHHGVTTVVRPWFGRGTCASHVSMTAVEDRACAEGWNACRFALCLRSVYHEELRMTHQLYAGIAGAARLGSVAYFTRYRATSRSVTLPATSPHSECEATSLKASNGR
jgi:hypothetical protein